MSFYAIKHNIVAFNHRLDFLADWSPKSLFSKSNDKGGGGGQKSYKIDDVFYE